MPDTTTPIGTWLAEEIARSALVERFQQLETMSTRQYAEWLTRRDIHVRWETVHRLWQLGVLRPIAVLAPALASVNRADQDRFHELDLGYDVASFVDVGMLPATEQLVNLQPAELDLELSDSLVWHPFQLWPVFRLFRVLVSRPTLDIVLQSPAQAGKWAALDASSTVTTVRSIWDDLTRSSFERLLLLLIRAEPLVHARLTGQISLPVGATVNDFEEWRQAQRGTTLLEHVGLTLDEVREWHQSLSITASLEDPARHFRPLFRQISYEQREKLEGKALFAHTVYHTAEILRTYVGEYFQASLPEEDEPLHGSQGPAIKQRLYGAPLISNADRTVRRRIAREFGVDPQARVRLFIEGPTEEGFLRRLTTRLGVDLIEAGLELVNLRGIGNIQSPLVHDYLRLLKQEHVFCFVSLDDDGGGEHVRALRHYAAEGLLTAGFRVWSPDFEDANFDRPELALAATNRARRDGVDVVITAAELQPHESSQHSAAGGAPRVPVGKLIETLLWTKAMYNGKKGPEWGAALADLVIDQDGASILDLPTTSKRPIVGILATLLRSQLYDFDTTADMLEVAPSGELRPRSDTASTTGQGEPA